MSQPFRGNGGRGRGGGGAGGGCASGFAGAGRGRDGKEAAKRKTQSIANGDRFCHHCDFLIFGQAKDRISHCVKCKKALLYESPDYQFSSGWGKCNSAANCGVMLHESMMLCYLCGFSNNYAWKKKEREVTAALVEAKKKALVDKESLAATIERLKAENLEQAMVIQTQEAEYFLLKEREEAATKDFNEAEASKTDEAPKKDDDSSVSNI